MNPANLLPNVAQGFSPGAAYSSGAPAQVSGNPVGQQAALAQSKKKQAVRNKLQARVLGMPNKRATSRKQFN